MRRKGFTLIELLVVIAIIGLLVSILVPSINQAQKMAKRAACASNLSGIGRSLHMYQTANLDKWPMIAGDTRRAYTDDGSFGTFLLMEFDSEPTYTPAMVNEDASGWIFNLDGESPYEGKNLNMVENLNLLFKEEYITRYSNFLCPQTGTTELSRLDPVTTIMYGFADEQGRTYVNYAYHLGYRYGRRVQNAARMSLRMNGNMVIAGDGIEYGDISDAEKSKRVVDFPLQNNPGEGYNHGDDGINVLDVSGSVNWSQTVLCGIDENNVYTNDMDRDGEIILDSDDISAPDGNDTGGNGHRDDSVLISIQPKSGG